jgi:hypothetical protein
MDATTYAMAWSVGEGPRSAGRIELDADALQLGSRLRVDLHDVTGVRLQRGVLAVAHVGGEPIHLVSLDRPGTLRELADLLSEATISTRPHRTEPC